MSQKEDICERKLQGPKGMLRVGQKKAFLGLETGGQPTSERIRF